MTNILHSSSSDEWYTPAWVIDAVKFVFGGHIAYDPTSSEAAQTIVRATRYSTIDDPALPAEQWPDRWYCNPPYSRASGGAKKWVTQAVISGKVGIMLVNATTDRQWFDMIWKNASAICFLKKRIKFLRAETDCNGETILVPGSSPTHGSCLVLFNANAELKFRFKHAFADSGQIISDWKDD